MKKIDELRLIAQCALGDNRHAFGLLVEAHQPQLRRFLMNLTGGDSALTDDLAQETFVKAWLNVRNFRGLSGFATWLYRIAYNEFCSAMRGRRALCSLEEAGVSEPADSSAAAVEAALTVREALGALGETERAVVSLFFIEDLPIKKIAGITGLPENTVKSHLRRGKEKLRQTIKQPD